jgi:hypothetical protein
MAAPKRLKTGVRVKDGKAVRIKVEGDDTYEASGCSFYFPSGIHLIPCQTETVTDAVDVKSINTGRKIDKVGDPS